MSCSTISGLACIAWLESLVPGADFGLTGSRIIRAVTETDCPFCIGEYTSVLVPGRCNHGFDGDSISELLKVERRGEDSGDVIFLELDFSVPSSPGVWLRNELLLSIVDRDVDRDTVSFAGGVRTKLSLWLSPSNVFTLLDILAPINGRCLGIAGTGSAGGGGHCGSAVDKLFVLPALLIVLRISVVLA